MIVLLKNNINEAATTHQKELNINIIKNLIIYYQIEIITIIFLLKFILEKRLK